MRVTFIQQGGSSFGVWNMDHVPRVGDHVEIHYELPAKEVVRVVWENKGGVLIFLVDT